MSNTSPSVEYQLKALIAAKLHRRNADIRGDASFEEDLGADSLDLVDLVLAIEDEFQVEIPDEEAAQLRTVRELVEYVTFASR